MYSESTLKKILSDLQSGKISNEEAFKRLKNFPYENLSFARIDHHRHIRTHIPEVIYAPGKTINQLKKIISSLKRAKQHLIVTRLDENIYKKIKKTFPFLSYAVEGKIAYYKIRHKKGQNAIQNTIAIVTAGTSDIPVAEEAAITLEVMNQQVVRLYDCGVAGVHRLVDVIPRLYEARAVICIAGMEGALASVLAGLVDRPIIAVPTSVGYGASFSGIAPLLTMMNSCAPGVAVVNIDNGFGAACFTLMILNTDRQA